MAREAQRIEDDAARAVEQRTVDRETSERETFEQRALEPATGPHLPEAATTGTDAEETARALALCVAEILSGAREVDSITRWVTDDVQRHLQQRAATAARARSATGRSAVRPTIRVGTAVVSAPREGVADASVVVHTRSHARAVAIRLEMRSGRWRATAIGML
ncbi:Rv3235 family protein [Curtobacterium sp. 9128]|uniref:Rv3235 family protein n=1 Tax=Curtobacterium sp. 9128 TaxID=1793722 RepID=UPI0011A355C6|nr:Rv3235 family protein [Curtobacterium sp. 9128]